MVLLANPIFRAYRGLHNVSCIMGNQGKMAGNSKVCMEPVLG